MAATGEPVYYLRSFHVKEDLVSGDNGGAGGAPGVDWSQTMGTITLTYRLQGGPREGVEGGWATEDAVVEMSKRSLKVTVGNEPLKALSGELLEEVWRHRSWWALEEGLLVIQFTKRELRTWKQPFYHVSLALGKRQSFPWTQAMLQHGDRHTRPDYRQEPPPDLPDESEMARVAAGRRETDDDVPPASSDAYFGMDPAEVFGPPSDRFSCSPEDLCIGISTSQDQHMASVFVHFERFAYDRAKATMPLESLFAADVRPRELRVFFKGDRQNPVLWAELFGPVLIEQTTWKLVSTEAMRKQQKELGSYSPALQITLHKDPSKAGSWPKVFADCMHHRLMVKEWADDGRPVRFEGPEGSRPLLRAGYNLDDPDFWGHVEHYVRATMKRTGHSSAPKKLQAC